MRPFTLEQLNAIDHLWSRSPDGTADIYQFRKRFTWYDRMDYIGGKWCGMFIGIERNGYTHT